MINFDYSGKQVRSVWRMVFGGGEWRDDIDASINGVFRSFWAFAFSAPFALLAFSAAYRIAASTPEFTATVYAKAPRAVLFSAEIIALGAYWAASIAALVLAARSIGATRQAGALIVAYNWGQLLTFIISAAPAAILVVTSDLDIFVLFALPVVAASFFINWRILRQTLPINIAVAIFLIALLTLIELAVNSAVTNAVVSLYLLFS